MSPLLVVDRSEVAGKIRRLRIALEHRPERGFQWREPRFVMAPMVDAVAIDRHAHLLGTGRAHGTRLLEEAQAAGPERKAAIGEQGPDFVLGVIDHAFVDDAMDAT